MRYNQKLISISLFIWVGVALANYQPQIESSFKAGNHRNIGRLSMLMPLWQRSDKLFYFNSIGMLDSKSAKELNLALGYRQIHKESISIVSLPRYAFLPSMAESATWLHART